MTNEDATNHITKMLDDLYKKDAFLLAQSLNVTERAITHRMGIYLQNILPKVDVDCEYNRMAKKSHGEIYYTGGDYFAKTVCLSNGKVNDDDDEGSRVYPDIIVHKRGTNINLIVIEVKVSWKSRSGLHDMKKLEAYKNDLKYEHAFYIELTEKRNDVLIKAL